MRKRTNARVYDEHLENIGVVYKIGAITNLTKGYILSSEYYNKLKDENNRDYIFLVQGIGNCFSKDGDSGSLVFSRSRKNYVDIVGMVYGSNPEVHDEDSEDENVGHNPELGGSKSLETEETELSPIKQDDKPFTCLLPKLWTMIPREFRCAIVLLQRWSFSKGAKVNILQ